ncbi:expressed unknown protein [Seminavis robusta]|uniref:Uncharacterized protein n=1 Tax=Seminavis robusta TaxID=568900 RepID=A0A9N8ETU0_9STRA|nr:expressed unknown protein [Seminavis robusta]|eukprot:Sro1668_g289890.1 n/a (242) ;mRNA; f:19353-20078
MLSTVHKQTGDIVDKTMVVPTRRLSELVTGISARSLSVLRLEGSTTKRVRFASMKEERHEYPAAVNLVDSTEELWYSMHDIQAAIAEDADAIRQQEEAKSGEDTLQVEPRGLEFYTGDQTQRAQAVTRYIRTIISKTHQNTKFSTQKLIMTGGKNGYVMEGDSNGSISRYSFQVTASAKDMAHRLAVEDELEARRIYLEDGVVASSSGIFLISETSDTNGTAARTGRDDGPRWSITAKVTY